MAIAELAMAGIGIGLQILGGAKATAAAKQASQVQRRISLFEQRIEEQRRLAMERDAERRQRQIMRDAQRTRSIALTTATSQGASQGTALGGAYGQISGQSSGMLLGVNQELTMGRSIFDINQQISGERMKLADIQSQAATAGGLSSLGGSLIGASKPFGSLFQSAFGGPSASSKYSGGSYSSFGGPTGSIY